MPELSSQSRLVATSAQVSTDLSGKKAILHLTNRTYYTLDGVGANVWELLQRETTVEEIVRALTSRYDVEPARCERDVRDLILDLRNNGLVEVR